MKIVTNTTPLFSPLTGIGKYTWQICRAMEKVAPENNYTYYYGYYSPRLFCAGQKRFSVVRIKDVAKNIPFVGRGLRLLKGARAQLGRNHFDVYFEPNCVPLHMPSDRSVVTIPDFSPFIYPEWHKREMVEFFRENFDKNIEKAAQIIAISDFIRNSAINEFGFSAEKVTRIYLGYDHKVFFNQDTSTLSNLKKKHNLPERFILYVGSIEPRKNLLRLMKAYEQLPSPLRREFKLVLAGFRGWGNAEVMKLLKVLKGDVFYLGYVPEADLAELYNLATIFVYPALYEGFGLPPLEAMACGCPVVVSNVASLPEVCGEAAAYIDPLQVDSISEMLLRLLEDETLLKELSEKGLSQAACFSWEKSAKEHLKVFAKRG